MPLADDARMTTIRLEGRDRDRIAAIRKAQELNSDIAAIRWALKQAAESTKANPKKSAARS